MARLTARLGLVGRCRRRWKKTTIADPEAAAAADLTGVAVWHAKRLDVAVSPGHARSLRGRGRATRWPRTTWRSCPVCEERESTTPMNDPTALAESDGPGPRLWLLIVAADEVVKNRLHLDLACDNEQESERLVAAGAGVQPDIPLSASWCSATRRATRSARSARGRESPPRCAYRRRVKRADRQRGRRRTAEPARCRGRG